VSVPIWQIDAFTSEVFGGNPAAVCLLDGPRPDDWMQNVATEMNLSETAFLWPEDGGFHLRWFTPTVEINLCGHATLASAHLLWAERVLAPEAEARFQTLSGLLTAHRSGEIIEMDFPAWPTAPVARARGLAQALGTELLAVGTYEGNLVVEVSDEQAVRNLRPDFPSLAEQAPKLVAVTARSSDSNFDFVSRVFVPALGIDEDPVTGSAHCCLGPYWQDKLGKDELRAFQASARGGIVTVRCHGERVALGGQAVTVLRGELLQ